MVTLKKKGGHGTAGGNHYTLVEHVTLLLVPQGPNSGYACEAEMEETFREKSIHEDNTCDGPITETYCLLLIHHECSQKEGSSDAFEDSRPR
ncbi:hypothetical protein PoB_000964100 [Plakobranchus ocellatus]|uniref:Uncharacterized protein n=1 Tax=Plakobranchus ocellatus TaxID=259542 RepID=A0AAV3Y793_9GAST|nr:hypothetical protein PoB_000964100 [Plakobranchus ocellatus]